MKTFEICSKGVCADIVLENGCPEGVKRIAEVLAGDIESVTGIRPRVLSALQDNMLPYYPLGVYKDKAKDCAKLPEGGENA